MKATKDHHIVLLSCVSLKLAHAAPAERLYISPLFRLALQYAKKLQPDAIYVLSAKHGLVSLDTMVEPYDLTLNAMSATERRAWATQVLGSLMGRADLCRDTVTFLAGCRYREHLLDHIPRAHVPLKGLGIGQQLQFLSRQAQSS